MLEPEPPPRLSQHDNMESSDQSTSLNVSIWLTSKEAADWFAWLSESDPNAIRRHTKCFVLSLNMQKELFVARQQQIIACSPEGVGAQDCRISH